MSIKEIGYITEHGNEVTTNSGVYHCLDSLMNAVQVYLTMDNNHLYFVDIKKGSTWLTLLDSGFMNHDNYTGGLRILHGALLASLCSCTANVPAEVIETVIKHGQSLGYYKHPETYIRHCRNESALRYFLDKGYTFRDCKINRRSIMEVFLSGDILLEVIADYPDAVDMDYVNENPWKMRQIYKRLRESDKDRTTAIEFVTNLMVKAPRCVVAC